MNMLAQWSEAVGRLRGLLPPTLGELRDLAVARRHPPTAIAARGELIIARVRQIAALFAILTAVWVLVDALNLPDAIWHRLALLRAATSLAFAILAIAPFEADTAGAAWKAPAALITLPLLFYLCASAILAEGEISSNAVTTYAYLPLIVAAGLSIFPFTAIESTLLGSLPILTMVAALMLWPPAAEHRSFFATVWRVALAVGISGWAGMSQLRFLLQLTEQATRDGLTGLLSRRVGDELLEHLFAYSVRNNAPLAVIFIDLDHFKTVNDGFGHEAGDDVLRQAGAVLKQAFRQQDILVRWGGEEFLVALPATDLDDAAVKLCRLAETGIGLRPDGRKMTASLGVAERKRDGIDNAKALVELADQRMYLAKRAGRNRYVLAEKPLPWIDAPAAPVAVAAD